MLNLEKKLKAIAKGVEVDCPPSLNLSGAIASLSQLEKDLSSKQSLTKAGFENSEALYTQTNLLIFLKIVPQDKAVLEFSKWESP